MTQRRPPSIPPRRSARLLAAALATSALLTIPTRGAAQSPLADPDVQGQIALFSAWLQGQIDIRGLPGVVVGVVAGDFEGASPDDPPVTIEHLLTHSSGLPREAGPHWTDWDFPTAEEIRALMPARQAPFSPEVRWKYSNLAYTIAGMVVEEVSGMSWADYLQQNIFDPLGMDASSVDEPDPLLATGYGRRMPDGSREVVPFVDARGMAAATGLTSTVEDMARFVSAQFREGRRGGERILGTAALREMHRVRMLENTWTRGQGIGFSVQRDDGTLYDRRWPPPRRRHRTGSRGIPHGSVSPGSIGVDGGPPGCW
ncbi:MAG: serine hydrolase [Gemmatimonadota bacterium]